MRSSKDWGGQHCDRHTAIIMLTTFGLPLEAINRQAPQSFAAELAGYAVKTDRDARTENGRVVGFSWVVVTRETDQKSVVYLADELVRNYKDLLRAVPELNLTI